MMAYNKMPKTTQQKEVSKRGKALGYCYKKLGLEGFVPAKKGSLLDQCIEAKLEKK
jgi:hypothetical protein